MSKSIYLLTKGDLSVKDGTISFLKDENEVFHFPVKQLEDVYININNKCTPNVLTLLLKEGILIHYFNNYEYYLGSFIPKNIRSSGRLLLKEVEHYNNHDYRMILAKAMIIASIKNCNKNVKYHAARGKTNQSIDLNEHINQIHTAQSINDLRLIEAQARKEYYRTFIDILTLESFQREFKPTDLINILLNFLNALLYSLVFSEIMKTKMSGQIGFIHEIDDNRHPLVYDIADIFKPFIVDRLIFKLVNRKQINQNDVEAGRIKEEKITLIFKEWNEQINTVIYHKSKKKYMSYRRLIREELYKLENHLNDVKTYKGFLIWW